GLGVSGIVHAVSVTVRPCAPSEWELWRELRLRALADAPDAFAEQEAKARARPEVDWRAFVAPRPDAVRLLAWDGATAVGMVVVVAALPPARSHVYAMWVAPAARRRGIGRALLATGLA